MSLRLRTNDLDWKQVDDEIVALDARQARYLAVNGTGVLLWQALDAGATREELVAALVERYRIDADRAGSDTDRFLAELTEQELLVR